MRAVGVLRDGIRLPVHVCRQVEPTRSVERRPQREEPAVRARSITRGCSTWPYPTWGAGPTMRGSERVKGMLSRVPSVTAMCRMYGEAVSSVPSWRKRASMDLLLSVFGSFFTGG